MMSVLIIKDTGNIQEIPTSRAINHIANIIQGPAEISQSSYKLTNLFINLFVVIDQLLRKLFRLFLFIVSRHERWVTLKYHGEEVEL